MEIASIDRKKEIIGLVKKLILIAFYFLMMFYISDKLADWIKNNINYTDPDLITVLFQYIVYVPLLILGIFMLTKDLSQSYKEMTSDKFWKIFGGVMVGLGLCYFGNFFGSMISEAIDPSASDSANQEAIEAIFKGKYGALMLLDVCIIGPIVEELVFRGAIQRGLLKLHIHPVVAILIASITFGFIHVIDAGDYAQVFPYIFMGISLGLTSYKSKSLVPNMIVHILINTIASSVLLIQSIISQIS